MFLFFFQAEDGIRDLVRSRGLGDVYKRQIVIRHIHPTRSRPDARVRRRQAHHLAGPRHQANLCLLYTSDAADERSSVDLGGRRIIKKKTKDKYVGRGCGDNKYRQRRRHTEQ